MLSAKLQTSRVIASIAASFNNWIIKSITKEYDAIFFCSREGAFFKMTHDLMNDLKDSPPSFHLEVSRRSLSVPLIESEDDIMSLIKSKPTRGFNLSSLLSKRFGINADIINDKDLSRLNKREVYHLVRKFKNEIMTNAAQEKENLYHYLNQKLKNTKINKVAIVDIGYNGTTQSKLEKLFPKTSFFGFYLLTFQGILQNIKGSNYDSFIFHQLNNIEIRNSITKNIAFMELLFTLGDYSVNKYDRLGNPIYNKSILNNPIIADIQTKAFDLIEESDHSVFSRFDSMKLINTMLSSPTKEMASLFINTKIEDDFGLGRTRHVLFDPLSTMCISNSEWKEGAKILTGANNVI